MTWEIFFRRETYSLSFSMRYFLSPWDFFLPRDKFSFTVRLFLSSWDCFFSWETCSFGKIKIKNHIPATTTFKRKIKVNVPKLLVLLLLTWKRGIRWKLFVAILNPINKTIFLSKTFLQSKVWDSLEQVKVYRGKLYDVSETLLSVH